MNYKILSRVVGVRKLGAVWFIIMEGSQEWISVGDEEPDIAKNDEVEIIIRKRQNV